MGQPYWCISGHAGDRITTARAATGTYVRVDIYYSMSPDDKFLVWLSGEVKTPPFSAEAVDYEPIEALGASEVT